MEREKLNIVCFREVLKTTHFNAFFCFTELGILERRIPLN